MPDESFHYSLYGNVKLVRAARIQAEGRIGARKIREAMVDSWAIPLTEWLAERLEGLCRSHVRPK
ncbi:hypothetical protein OR221_0814 [Microbacterium laevaniformans OR221]|nr:hypothetical protein OR221_0814 [Microbacterium laevaniformans OR221]